MFPIRACVAKCATLALLCLMPASAHSQEKFQFTACMGEGAAPQNNSCEAAGWLQQNGLPS